MYILSTAAFDLQWQSGVVATETIQPAKLEKFTVWHFTEGLLTPVLALRGFREVRPGHRTCAKNTFEAKRVNITLSRERMVEGNTF